MLATITLATHARPVRHVARLDGRHGRRRRARDRRRHASLRHPPAGARDPHRRRRRCSSSSAICLVDRGRDRLSSDPTCTLTRCAGQSSWLGCLPSWRCSSRAAPTTHPPRAQPRQRQRRPRPHPAVSGRDRQRRASRPVVPRGHPTPALRVRPDRHPAGPEHHRVQQGSIPKPDVDGWIVGSAQPPARGRHGPARRRHPPAPRRVAQHVGARTRRPRVPERFFAAGEEKTRIELPARLRLPVQDDRPLAPQLHAPQPDARSRDKVWITYDIDFIPATVTGRGEHRRPRIRSGWTCRTAASTRCSTCIKGTRHERHVHLSRPGDRPVPGRPAEERVDRRPTDGMLVATAGHLHPGGLHDDL